MALENQDNPATPADPQPAAGRTDPAIGDDLDLGRVGPQAGPSEASQLSEREILIAQGEDPDSPPESSDPPSDPAPEPQAKIPAAPATPREPAAASDGWPDWADRAVQFNASQLRYTPEQLSHFSSADDFYGHLELLEQNMKQMAGYYASQSRAPEAKPGQSGDEDDPPRVLPTNEDGTINYDYFLKAEDRGEEGFEDETLALVRHSQRSDEMLKSLMERVERFEKQQEEYEQYVDETAFHDALDSLSPDLFGISVDDQGQPVEISDDQANLRNRVLNKGRELRELAKSQAEQAGQPYRPEPWDTLSLKAYVLETGKLPSAPAQPATATRQQQPQAAARSPQAAPTKQIDEIDPLRDGPTERERLLRQANRVRGAGGANGPTQPPVYSAEEDEAMRIANHPDVVKTWNRLQSSNGSV